MQQSLLNPLSLFSLWSALVRVSLTVLCLFHVSRDIPGDKHNLKHLKQEHITHILKMVRNSTCVQPTQAKVGNQICAEFQTPFWKVKLVTLVIKHQEISPRPLDRSHPAKIICCSQTKSTSNLLRMVYFTVKSGPGLKAIGLKGVKHSLSVYELTVVLLKPILIA